MRKVKPVRRHRVILTGYCYMFFYREIRQDVLSVMMVLVVVFERRHLFFYLYLTQSIDIIEQYGFEVLDRNLKLSAVVIVSYLAGIFVYFECERVSRKALGFGHSQIYVVRQRQYLASEAPLGKQELAQQVVAFVLKNHIRYRMFMFAYLYLVIHSQSPSYTGKAVVIFLFELRYISISRSPQ